MERGEARWTWMAAGMIVLALAFMAFGCSQANGNRAVILERGMDGICEAGLSEEQEASHGVQVRLAAERTAWKEAETPSFTASIQNGGTGRWIVYQAQTMWAVELDGVRYVWMGDVSAKGSSLPPGRQYDGIPITLVDSWQQARGGTPLKLAPGKHTLRAICPVLPPAGQQGAATARFEAVSNPAEFEVTPAK